ncbi:DUF3710 domain-containing protein [Mycolicibacterium arenosum]|uniref:DUF3710 domain-containing protein n=1 Tax=Mycolicibacterium arenosum TaxID=2952157 RepID=A0ABT1M1Q3_9MYCO|nr:DUF3710 domain-containing protein [Mycolicibacterium sp. CAU 1645]MCP9273073.1 DUF3710 domain-containing protein [Mycolicibacterium sp. CAU 1645]
MAFGKRKRDDDTDAGGHEAAADVPERTAGGAADAADVDDGPFDIEDFDDPDLAAQGRHDLGSVLIPMDETAELAVEVNQQGVPTMVWMVTPNGRYNVTAYAAPKTGGLWREVITEVAESLRKEGAQVSFEDGPWGREVVGLMTKGPEPVTMRFIGVDGYRWMIRGAAVGSPDNAPTIAADVRNALTDTVVRRGDTPLPVRFMLPLQLSEQLVARLRARAEQMVAQNAAPPPPEPPQPAARRSEQGSAMQQLRTITGG